MKKLHEILHLNPFKGDVGLEFEAEGQGMRIVDTDNWRTERDGSLRGIYPEECAEFVLAKPIAISEVGNTMDELLKELNQAKFNFSFRTSSHVHVNVQELTEDEMLAFLYLVLIFEKPLTGFCGESRQGNRFCLRLSDADGYADTLESMFKRCKYTMQRLDGNAIRYAAVNIHSLKKYGSIEFRGMRGNLDKNVMIPWCETLVHLRDYAKKLGSPIEVYNKYIATPIDLFAKESLGKHFELFNSADNVRDIEQSFSLTIDLPHAFKRKEEDFEGEDEAPKAFARKFAMDPAPRPRHAVDDDAVLRNKAGAAAMVAMKIAQQAYHGAAEQREVFNNQDQMKVYLEAFRQARMVGLIE